MVREVRGAVALALAVLCPVIMSDGAAAKGVERVHSKLNVSAILSDSSTDIGAYGIVTSSEKACVDNRRVYFFVDQVTDARVLDAGRTGKHGGWVVRADVVDVADINSITFRLGPKTVKTKHGKIRCGGRQVKVK